jgi:hypothetical protein
MTEPYGYTSWANVMILPVLLATHFKAGATMVGGVFEASYLGKQRQYIAHHEGNASWRGAFAALGLPLFSPVVGFSEVATSQIVCDHKMHTVALYCQNGEGGVPCGACFKCLRKHAMKVYHNVENRGWYDTWKPYANQTEAALSPLHPASISNALIYDKIEHLLPVGLGAWARKLKNIPSLRSASNILARKFYRPALQTIPEAFRPELLKALEKEGFKLTNEEEENLIVSMPAICAN